jgi:colanic acid/amylovoran biosynthesis protein
MSSVRSSRRAHEASGEAPLRIVVDPSGYTSSNIGDTAMLEVALGRLRSFWPLARLQVLFLERQWIEASDPPAEFLDAWGPYGWSADGALIRTTSKLAPFADPVLASCRTFRRWAPGVMRQIARAALVCTQHDPRAVDRYLEAIRGADLLLVTGAGSISDAFKLHALVVLETIELALAGHAVTALVGQGIGPLADPLLRKRVASVLGQVDMLTLRDRATSLPLLESMGLPASRLEVTGDDAIALGRAAWPGTLGSAIGVNLRTAPYAGVGPDVIEVVATVVRDAARRHGTSLVAVPVMRAPGHDDLSAARQLIGDASPVTAASGPTTPAELLQVLRGCRLVVAGSYHAALLALAMGIPAVAIVSSDYYAHKFRGLAGQFGHDACRIETTSDPAFAGRLKISIDEVWESGEALRDRLADAAANQVALSEASYQRLFELVHARSKRRG